MPYIFKPHRHVKIWLSKDKDVFLNPENQLRLVKMRQQCPGDEIYFVYAASLLSKKAQSALWNFCVKHDVHPVSIEERVIPEVKTEEERALLRISEQEIKALRHGGNLAAASDVLRWLSPIYCLGVYTDFDVEVKTQGVPAEIEVDAPLLINAGSNLNFSVGDTDLETLLVNNDIIAVVDWNEAGLAKVKAVQRSILNFYDTHPYDQFCDRAVKAFEPYVGRERGAEVLKSAEPFQICMFLSTPPFKGITLIKLRKQIEERLSRLDDFVEEYWHFFLKCQPFDPEFAGILPSDDAKTGFCKIIREPMAMCAESFLFHDLPEKAKAKIREQLSMSEKDMLKQYAREFYQKCYKGSVSYSTGPFALCFGLFQNMALLGSIVDREVVPYAISHYNLSSVFHSPQTVAFHVSMEEVIEAFENAAIGSHCDISWTTEGAIAQSAREKKMGASALAIQSLFRSHRVRQTPKDSSPDISTPKPHK